MPIYEGKCQSVACVNYGKIFEYYVSHWSKDDKDCPACNITLSRLIGLPNVVWGKPLSWYKGESGDGHWVTHTNDDGSKEQRLITTRQEQLDHCKRNGLYDPMEVPRDVGLDDKGKSELKSKATWI